MTNTAHSLGETRLALHDVDGARIDYDQVLLVSQRIGDLQGQANALLGLAKTDLMREDFAGAQGRAREAAKIYGQIDDGLGAANTLVTVGDLVLAQGQFADGDTAYANAEVEFTALSCPLNFPRHTQTDITPSIVSRLAAEFPLLRGVKDSGTDRGITRQFKAARPDMQVFVGDDRAGARLSKIGVDGLVTGGGGPVVELPLRIVDAVQGDDLEYAHQLQADFDQWSDARRASPLTEIAFVKAALAARLPGFPPTCGRRW
ncbi:MAG: dihydrodipicolinate synthase family protein [Pseudonocardiaceae bacterium]